MSGSMAPYALVVCHELLFVGDDFSRTDVGRAR